MRLELTRVLPVPRSVVFGAFSDPTQLAEWWGPEGFTTPSLSFQPRVGGRYRIEMVAVDQAGNRTPNPPSFPATIP